MDAELGSGLVVRAAAAASSSEVRSLMWEKLDYVGACRLGSSAHLPLVSVSADFGGVWPERIYCERCT